MKPDNEFEQLALPLRRADGPLPPAGDAPRQVTRISMFLDAGLFPAFGLPLTLSAAARAARD
jgi:hypothetical protein